MSVFLVQTSLLSVLGQRLLKVEDIWCFVFLSFPHQAFKDMLYAAQDQAPSIEGKETNKHTLLYWTFARAGTVWAPPE